MQALLATKEGRCIVLSSRIFCGQVCNNKKYICSYKSTHMVSLSPYILDLLSEEFTEYQLLQDADIPQDNGDKAAVAMDNGQAYHRIRCPVALLICH